MPKVEDYKNKKKSKKGPVKAEAKVHAKNHGKTPPNVHSDKTETEDIVEAANDDGVTRRGPAAKKTKRRPGREEGLEYIDTLAGSGGDSEDDQMDIPADSPDAEFED
ncbi:MAG: hypothetical protein V4736_00140, partial [Bdellovibrionota bacterium]